MMPSLTTHVLSPWSRLRAHSRANSITKSESPSDSLSDSPVEVSSEKSIFGLPDFDDPDPFGVLALEKEGLLIKEAGTQRRPSSDAFEYRPSPSSPMFNAFSRRSTEIALSRPNSRRESKQSITSLASLDRGTQTANFDPPTIIEEASPEHETQNPIEKTTEDLATISDVDEEAYENDYEEEPDVIVEEPTVAVQCITPTRISPVVLKPRLVTIPKRIPPQIPPRSPFRGSRPETAGSIMESISDGASMDTKVGEEMSSRSSSPYKSGFYGDILGESGNPWHDEEPMSPLSDTDFKAISIASKYPDPLDEVDLKEISVTPTDVSPLEDGDFKPVSPTLEGVTPVDNKAEEEEKSVTSLNNEVMEELKKIIPADDGIFEEPNEPVCTAQADVRPTDQEVSQDRDGFHSVGLAAKDSNNGDEIAISEPPAANDPNGPAEKVIDDREDFHSVPTTPLEVPGAFF